MAEQSKISSYSNETGKLVFPWRLRILLKLGSVLMAHARRPDGSLNRRLSDLFEPKVPSQQHPLRGISSHDVIIDPETGIWVRIFKPAARKSTSVEVIHSAPPLPIIFYFHGGGFATFSANCTVYNSLCKHLCKLFQAVVICVDYRRSPEHRYPIAYDDCFSALTWLQGEGKDHIPSEADISRCFLMGDSAGGNIVHHVGCKAATDGSLNDSVRIIGHILLFPFFGGEERTAAELRLINVPMLNYKMTDWAWQTFLPPGANRDHQAANVFGPNAPDISNLQLPPSIVTVGEYDCLKDWQIRYVNNLKKIGKDVQLLYYEGGVHAFHVFPSLHQTAQLFIDVQEFIRSRCNADQNGSPGT